MNHSPANRVFRGFKIGLCAGSAAIGFIGGGMSVAVPYFYFQRHLPDGWGWISASIGAVGGVLVGWLWCRVMIAYATGRAQARSTFPEYRIRWAGQGLAVLAGAISSLAVYIPAMVILKRWTAGLILSAIGWGAFGGVFLALCAVTPLIHATKRYLKEKMASDGRAIEESLHAADPTA